MEIREFAQHILCVPNLTVKLQAPPLPLTDIDPGKVERIETPARPQNLQFAAPRTAPPMPKPGAFRETYKRAVAHHIMANHELQALEVMAFVLLAFPDAPAEYRQGMIPIMLDEQRHTRMHMERAAKLGVEFGSLPVNCYIWKKAQQYETLLDYLAGLVLTFEGRNLDHSLEFEEYFLAVDDRRSAALMRTIHHDEIGHVRFGAEWLQKLKPPEQSDWETYCEHLHWPIRPTKSVGETFNRGPRLEAGLTAEFVEELEKAVAQVPKADRGK